MLKRLRSAHPMLYCLVAEVLFLGMLFVASLLSLLLILFVVRDIDAVDDYMLTFMQEAAGVLVAWLFLARTGKSSLLRRRGSGFFNGLLVGLYPITLIGYNAYNTLLFGRPEGDMLPAWHVVWFLIGMTSVGVAEEFLFRGVIAQTLLEHFGTSRAGVWEACLLSGFYFGAALYLTHPELKPPFLCLVASGGHSHIVEVQDYTHYHILGHTVDDAAGEAFDKVARTLGLPYPGGPSVANAAKTGDPKAYRLPVPHVEGRYNVSFSGLKTAVLNEANQAQMKGTDINVPDLAASFQERIAGILAEKLLLAAADTGAKQVCLAGGVAANGRLRQLVNDGAQKLGARVYLPELKFCGDNGAMIAAQGYYQYIAGHTAGLELNGLPTLPIDYE